MTSTNRIHSTRGIAVDRPRLRPTTTRTENLTNTNCQSPSDGFGEQHLAHLEDERGVSVLFCLQDCCWMTLILLFLSPQCSFFSSFWSFEAEAHLAEQSFASDHRLSFNKKIHFMGDRNDESTVPRRWHRSILVVTTRTRPFYPTSL